MIFVLRREAEANGCVSLASTASSVQISSSSTVNLTTTWYGGPGTGQQVLSTRVLDNGNAIKTINPTTPMQTGSLSWSGTFADGVHQLGTQWATNDGVGAWTGPGGCEGKFWVDTANPSGSLQIVNGNVTYNAMDNVDVKSISFYANYGSGYGTTPYTSLDP
jgi:hypothetical protein